MIVLKHVQYITWVCLRDEALSKRERSIIKGNVRVVQRTLKITNSKKKIGRCLKCWTKSNVHVLSDNLETTYCPYPTSIRDSYAFPIFAPPPLYSLFASAPSLYPSITVIYCSKGYPCSDREMGLLSRPYEKFKLIQKFYIVKLPKIPPPPPVLGLSSEISCYMA